MKNFGNKIESSQNFEENKVDLKKTEIKMQTKWTKVVKSTPKTEEAKQIDDKQQEEKELKCKVAAIVMDRLFFFLALIYAIITFVALIMTIPNFYK